MLQVVGCLACWNPLQERDKVFTPFWVPETAGVNVPGTGIGLSLVYSIVKLHKGVIRIEDQDGTEGARFIVLLPVSREAFTEEDD